MTRHDKSYLERVLARRRTPANTIRCGKFRIRVDRAKDLLTLAIYISCLGIVTAAVMYTEGGSNPTWRLLLVLLVSLGTAAGGICLLVSILRSGKNS